MFGRRYNKRQNKARSYCTDPLEIRVLPSRIIDGGPGTPIDINDVGQVLYVSPSGVPVVWNMATGTRTRIEKPSGYQKMVVVDMNNSGAVTGYLKYNAVQFRAFVWRSGTFRYLTDGAVSLSGDVPSSLPSQILDSGAVVGVTRKTMQRGEGSGEGSNFAYIPSTIWASAIWTTIRLETFTEVYAYDRDPNGLDDVVDLVIWEDVAAGRVVRSQDLTSIVGTEQFATATGVLLRSGRAVTAQEARDLYAINNDPSLHPFADPRISWSTSSGGKLLPKEIITGRYGDDRVFVGTSDGGAHQNDSVYGQAHFLYANESGLALVEGQFGDFVERFNDTGLDFIGDDETRTALIRDAAGSPSYVVLPASIEPIAVNSSQWVVGTPLRLGSIFDGGARLWRPGIGVTDVETLLPADADWTLFSAVRVNDRMQILGRGTNNKLPGGGERIYVLTSLDNPAGPMPVSSFTNLRDTANGSTRLRFDYTVPAGDEVTRFKVSFGGASDAAAGARSAIATLLTVEVTPEMLQAGSTSRNGLPGFKLINSQGDALPVQNAFKPGTHRLQVDIRDTLLESAVHNRQYDKILVRAGGQWATLEGIYHSPLNRTLTIRGRENAANNVAISQSTKAITAKLSFGNTTQAIPIPVDQVDDISVFGGQKNDRIELTNVEKSSELKGRQGRDTYAFGGRTSRRQDIIDTKDAELINENVLDFSQFAVPIRLNLENAYNNVNKSVNLQPVVHDNLVGTVIGTRFKDWIKGDDFDNVLIGGPENDTISGGKGNDRILGDSVTVLDDKQRRDRFIDGLQRGLIRSLGGGWNTVGTGNDFLFGGEGNDFSLGGGGSDDIDEESGENLIIAGGIIVPATAGNTALNVHGQVNLNSVPFALRTMAVMQVWFATAKIKLAGTEGDGVVGGTGQDVIYGSNGIDFIQTGGGSTDVAFGGGSVDVINGAESEVTFLFGGDGNDTLTGGKSFAFAMGDGVSFLQPADIIPDFTEVISLDVFGTQFQLPTKGTLTIRNPLVQFRGSGTDTIVGGAGMNVAIGGAGNDTLDLSGGRLNLAIGDGIPTDPQFRFDFSPILLLVGRIGFLKDSANVTDFMAFTSRVNTIVESTLKAVDSLIPAVKFVSTIPGGDDTIKGGSNVFSIDLLFGNEGVDTILPTRGFNVVFAGDGNDVVEVRKPFGQFEEPLLPVGMNLMFGEGGDDRLQIFDDSWLGNFVFGDGYNAVGQLNFSFAPKENSLEDRTLPAVVLRAKLTARASLVEITNPGNDRIFLNWNANDEIPGEGDDPDLITASAFNFVSGGSGDDHIRSAASHQIIIGDAVEFGVDVREFDLSAFDSTIVPTQLDTDPQNGKEIVRAKAEYAFRKFMPRIKSFAKPIPGMDVLSLFRLTGSGNDRIRTCSMLGPAHLGSPLDVIEVSIVFAGDGNDVVDFIGTRLPLPRVAVAFGGEGNDDLSAVDASLAVLAGDNGDDILRGPTGAFSTAMLVGDSYRMPLNLVGRIPLPIEVNFSLSGTIGFSAGLTFDGKGNDTIIAHSGFNFCVGGDGNDTINGGNGIDVLVGDEFNLGTRFQFDFKKLVGWYFKKDRLSQNASENLLRESLDFEMPFSAGIGDDRITTSGFGNIVLAGAGRDIVAATRKSLISVILAGNGNDIVETNSVFNAVWGGIGNDRITANSDSLANLLVGDEQRGGGIYSVMPREIRVMLEEGQMPKSNSLFALPNTNDGNDILTGSNQGFDILIGCGGTDQLYGRDGVNVMMASSTVALVDAEFQSISVKGWTRTAVSAGINVDQVFRPADVTGITPNESNTIVGGSGVDLVFGSFGKDTISTFDGTDLVFAAAGDDIVKSGNGMDLVYGQSGHDEIRGEGGPNLLIGGTGNDKINGGHDGNVIFGDEVRSGIPFSLEVIKQAALLQLSLRNMIVQGDGNDILLGGAGTDLVIGGLGNDSIVDFGGTNILIGDEIRSLIPAGMQLFNLVSSSGSISVSRRLGVVENMFFGPAILAPPLTDRDTITGGSGIDIILGGRDSDSLDGSGGTDLVYGGDRTDSLWGGAALDIVIGGDGTDHFWDLYGNGSNPELDIPLTDFFAVEDLLRG